MKIFSLILLTIIACSPSFVHAETVIRVGDNVSLSADQTVEGDYYVSSGAFGNTTISGKVSEDVYAIGAAITNNGTISKDFSALGATMHVHGDVKDDVRIIAGDATIAEHVGGDVFVIAGSLKVLSNATVDGDIIFFGGTAEINGKVGGSIVGSSEKIRVDAEVGKNIDVKTATTLTLGEKAVVNGFVRYTSVDDMVRAQNATVVGEITHSTPGIDSTDVREEFKSALIPFFISLFAALCLFLFGRKHLQNIVQIVHKSGVKVALFGFLTTGVGPFVALVLLLTVLGSLVGALVGLLVGLAVVSGLVLMGTVFGSYLSKMATNHAVVSLPWIVAGTAGIHILLFVPIVGPLLVLGAFIMTVGGIVLFIYGRF